MCPMYEYKCDKCENIIEQIFSIKDFPRTVICECGNAAHKIISKSSFRLEGGGWATDGYVSKMDKFRANMQAVDNY